MEGMVKKMRKQGRNHQNRRDRERYHIEGNTVRKPQYEPVRAPLRRQQPGLKKRPAARPVSGLHLEMLLRVGFFFLIGLAVYMSVAYIQAQSGLRSQIKSLERSQKELELLRSANDEMEVRLNTYVDLDYIQEYAVNTLGMVYADETRVIRYNKTESEYVIQNEDIPN